MGKTRSLADYIAEYRDPRVKACRVCTLAQVDEIDEGLDAGIYRSRVLDWLQQEHGIELDRNHLDRHAKHRRAGAARVL